MKRIFSGLAALALTSTFGACAFEHSSTVLSPSSLAGSASGSTQAESSAPSFVGAWASQSVGVPTPSSCTNFQWTVTSQTATSMTGNFSAQCADGITVTGTASGQLNGTTVPITATGNASLPGIPSCSFTLTGTGTIEDNATALRVPYSGTTCLGPISGTEVLHKKSDPAPPSPPPPPAPEPTPPPPAVSGPSSNDQLNLHAATIMNSPTDVAYWAETARITGLNIDGNGIHIDFTKKDGPGSWPDVSFMTPGENLQYTVWIMINVNGRWYASGCLQFWRGLDRMGGPPSQYAQNWYYDPIRWGPMVGHQPQPGEQVGFLVTAGDARNNGNVAVRERSNVVSIPFPSGGGSWGW